MKRQNDDVRARRQNPFGTDGIQLVNSVAERPKRSSYSRTGAQGHLALSRRPAQHDRDVQSVGHASPASALGVILVLMVFRFTSANGHSFADNFNLGFQLDAPAFFGPLFYRIDQLQNVLRRRAAFVDDEITVHRRDHRGALPHSFQAEFVDELARWY